MSKELPGVKPDPRDGLLCNHPDHAPIEIEHIGDVIYIDGYPKYYIRGMHYNQHSYIAVYKLAGHVASNEYLKDFILSMEGRDNE